MIKSLPLPPDQASPAKPQRGFSLIEIAVTLFILTLVLGALLMPLATQVEERQVRETERIMNEMMEALVGYAISQTTPRLPCPDRTSGGAGTANDTANDGIEDYVGGGACQVSDGNVPWVTLGVNATDFWGNRYRYLAHPDFTTRAIPTMSLSSPTTPFATIPHFNICAAAPNSANCGGTTYVANNVPAIIISHGRNGYGAMNGSSNTQISTTGASTHEVENTPGGTYANSVVSKIRSDAAGQQFDDIVVWLSPNVLFNRLVSANKLP
jgi:prepilin-type N-terminal cleavage/methylation domain-containing protein